MSPRRLTDSDHFWWALSGAAGIGAVILAKSMANLDSTAIRVASFIIPIAIPAIVGYLRPDRPWRWALAYFLVNRLVVAPSIFREGGSTAFWIVSLLLLLPLNLAGAYLGYAMNRRKREVSGLPSQSRPSRIATWAVVSSLVIGGSVFVTGFFGPMVLDPTAAQGPLVGFLLAPPAALLGLVLGGIAAGFGDLSDKQLRLLLAGAAIVCVVSLTILMALAD